MPCRFCSVNSDSHVYSECFSARPVVADCKVDLAFLMDGSWSIGKRRFKIQKDFLSDVAQAINVGVAGPMMGIIQYG